MTIPRITIRYCQNCGAVMMIDGVLVDRTDNTRYLDGMQKHMHDWVRDSEGSLVSEECGNVVALSVKRHRHSEHLYEYRFEEPAGTAGSLSRPIPTPASVLNMRRNVRERIARHPILRSAI